MSNKLDKIHHLAIQVDNIARAVQWYKLHMKCRVNYQDDSWAMIEFANIELALVLPDQHPPHFAIECSNISQFGEPVTHRDGTQSVYTQDIDKNVIEMLKLSGE
jgi:catechol 2,3-dioxygenase-like lactoylglutathione lyase family enzyme|tara:strand:- start:6340 stop:6651 length:312 start_codon:yes stop_codon:yes gene_type:complete